MTIETKYIFDVLKFAGVRIVDFSVLTDISRTTLHRWKADYATPQDKIRLAIAYEKAKKLDAARIAGLLPFLHPLPPETRRRQLKQLIDRMTREQV